MAAIIDQPTARTQEVVVSVESTQECKRMLAKFKQQPSLHVGIDPNAEAAETHPDDCEAAALSEERNARQKLEAG